MANQHGKVVTAAVLHALAGEAPRDPVTINNTCYSFITDRAAVHVASVHRYDEAQRTFLPVAGAGGLSSAMSEREGEYAFGWAHNIWRDSLGG
jgi:sulfite dehydrogenase